MVEFNEWFGLFWWGICFVVMLVIVGVLMMLVCFYIVGLMDEGYDF